MNSLSVVHFLHKQSQGGVILPALGQSKWFLSPLQERVTSKGGPFPRPPSYELEWPCGDLLASSSHSNYHTESPAFVAGFQGSPLHGQTGQSRVLIAKVYTAWTSISPINESPHQHLRNSKYTENYIIFSIQGSDSLTLLKVHFALFISYLAFTLSSHWKSG